MNSEFEEKGNDEILEQTRDVGLGRAKIGLVGGMVALSGGTAISQAIGLCSLPVITRLFLEAEYGVAAVFASLVAMIPVISCLRYELALMLPKTDKEAANILVLCGVAIAVINGLIVLAVAFGAESMLRLIQMEELVPYRWLIPLGTLLPSVILMMQAWNARYKRFKWCASAQVADRTAISAFAITCGVLGFTGGQHLILARLAGTALAPIMFAWHFLANDMRYVVKSFSARVMLQMANRYRKFPLYDSWSALLQTVSTQLPVILLAGFFGKEAVGRYALCMVVINMPSQLISKAVGTVFFQRASELSAKSGTGLGYLTSQLYKRLLTLGLLPMIMLVLAGPELFGVVLSGRWTIAGLYAGILAPWTFLAMANFPIDRLFFVLERQGYDLFTNITRVLLRIVAIVAGGAVIGDITWALVLFSAVNVVMLVWRGAFLFRLARVNVLSIIISLALDLLRAVPMAATIVAAKYYFQLSPIWIVTACIAGAIMYLALIYQAHEDIRIIANKLTKRILRRK